MINVFFFRPEEGFVSIICNCRSLKIIIIVWKKCLLIDSEKRKRSDKIKQILLNEFDLLSDVIETINYIYLLIYWLKITEFSANSIKWINENHLKFDRSIQFVQTQIRESDQIFVANMKTNIDTKRFLMFLRAGNVCASANLDSVLNKWNKWADIIHSGFSPKRKCAKNSQ